MKTGFSANDNTGAKMKHDVTVETGKFAIGGAGVTLYALTLNEWVAIVTIIYFITQWVYLIWKWWKEYNAPKAKKGTAAEKQSRKKPAAKQASRR
ncbi:MAG: hypothetical protein WC091_02745 [Sulfuricellaceae bacterium]